MEPPTGEVGKPLSFFVRIVSAMTPKRTLGQPCLEIGGGASESQPVRDLKLENGTSI